MFDFFGLVCLWYYRWVCVDEMVCVLFWCVFEFLVLVVLFLYCLCICELVLESFWELDDWYWVFKNFYLIVSYLW